MKIIGFFRLRDGYGADDIAPFLVEEELWAWNRYMSGAIRELNVAPSLGGVVCMLEAESLDAAKQQMADLPLAKRGMVEVELHELKPFQFWATLFAESVRKTLGLPT